jgi:hypothetical protein
MRRVILILVLAVAPVSASGVDHRTNSVGEPVFASPALAGRTIFIRGNQHLFAIRSSS